MRYTSEDFTVNQVDNHFTISIRQPFLWGFFNLWTELTHADIEVGEEEVIKFSSKKQAELFIRELLA